MWRAFGVLVFVCVVLVAAVWAVVTFLSWLWRLHQHCRRQGHVLSAQFGVVPGPYVCQRCGRKIL